MIITVDLFAEYPKYSETLLPSELVFYSEIISFIQQRLSPLKEQIDNEEKINSDSFICINMLHFNKRKTFITLVNYTEDLQAKMRSCFSTEDFKFLNDKIMRMLKESGIGI